MNVKFGRSYRMTVAGRSSTPSAPINIEINFPLTLEFTITHNIFASANTANFSMYNLSVDHRSEITFNQFLKARPYPVTLLAGYISEQPKGLYSDPAFLPTVFDGFANVAYTERVGSDLITRINAIDNGDLTTGKAAGFFSGSGPDSYTAKPGTDFVTMVKAVMGHLTGGVKPGEVRIDARQLPPPLPKERPFTGNVWQALQDLAREANFAHVYIENGVCNMLGQDDVLLETGSMGILRSETGLLGVPRYTGNTIMVSSIFEPTLKIGARIELKSEFNEDANGMCKIVAYTHRGTMSGVSSREAISEITLMKLDTPLGHP